MSRSGSPTYFDVSVATSSMASASSSRKVVTESTRPLRTNWRMRSTAASRGLTVVLTPSRWARGR